MFSIGSRSATGSRSLVGAMEPVPQTSTAVTGDSSVQPLNSTARPVTSTRSPTSTSLKVSRA
ncbi:hypothetical protein AB0J42_20965 [Nonomuraea sp. NPDC049649]|uniref:hypothetical protein n=1 Tax=Nonomuraea sp. NPDC049649 TaxID=3155776 RepID=UPI00342C360F